MILVLIEKFDGLEERHEKKGAKKKFKEENYQVISQCYDGKTENLEGWLRKTEQKLIYLEQVMLLKTSLYDA